jgi:hypothetical protein
MATNYVLDYREAFYAVHFHTAITSLIFQLITCTIEYLYCSLNISYVCRRSLRHLQAELFSKPSAYCKAVTVAELQSISGIFCFVDHAYLYNLANKSN